VVRCTGSWARCCGLGPVAAWRERVGLGCVRGQSCGRRGRASIGFRGCASSSAPGAGRAAGLTRGTGVRSGRASDVGSAS
jgi:hypothetical protein